MRSIKWIVMPSFVVILLWFGTGLAGFDEMGKWAQAFPPYGQRSLFLSNDCGPAHNPCAESKDKGNGKSVGKAAEEARRQADEARKKVEEARGNATPGNSKGNPGNNGNPGYLGNPGNNGNAGNPVNGNNSNGNPGSGNPGQSQSAAARDNYGQSVSEEARQHALLLGYPNGRSEDRDEEARKKVLAGTTDRNANDRGAGQKKQLTPHDISSVIVAKMVAIIQSLSCGTQPTLEKKQVKMKRKDGSVLIFASGEFRCNGIENEINVVAAVSAGYSSMVVLAAEEIDLQHWSEIQRQTRVLRTDVTFTLEGYLNLSGLSAQWQDATTTINIIYGTGDASGTRYINTRSTGSYEMSVVSTTTVNGVMQVVIVPSQA